MFGDRIISNVAIFIVVRGSGPWEELVDIINELILKWVKDISFGKKRTKFEINLFKE